MKRKILGALAAAVVTAAAVFSTALADDADTVPSNPYTVSQQTLDAPNVISQKSKAKSDYTWLYITLTAAGVVLTAGVVTLWCRAGGRKTRKGETVDG